MAWEWRVLFILFLVAGAVSLAIGLILLMRRQDTADGTHTTRVRTPRYEFEQATTSIGLALLVLGALMWVAGGAIVVGAREGAQKESSRPPQPPSAATDQAIDGSPITVPRRPEIIVNPEASVSAGTLTTVPATTPATIIIPRPTVDATPPENAAVEACDDRWAVSLGSTLGVVKHPDQFLADMQAQYDDPTLRLLMADSCASLAPGTWVVFGGIYQSSEEAISECAMRDLTSGEDCFALPLTTDPEDRSLRVFP